MAIDKSKAKKEIKKSFEEFYNHPLAIISAYFVGGLLIFSFLPFSVLPEFVQTYIGALIILIGLLPLQWAVRTMYRDGYQWTPMQRNLYFGIDGPYRYTRNPVYLSYCFFFVGFFMFINNIFGILLVIPLGMTLTKKVIIPNETELLELHGEDYEDYQKKVSRWL